MGGRYRAPCAGATRLSAGGSTSPEVTVTRPAVGVHHEAPRARRRPIARPATGGRRSRVASTSRAERRRTPADTPPRPGRRSRPVRVVGDRTIAGTPSSSADGIDVAEPGAPGPRPPAVSRFTPMPDDHVTDRPVGDRDSARMPPALRSSSEQVVRPLASRLRARDLADRSRHRGAGQEREQAGAARRQPSDEARTRTSGPPRDGRSTSGRAGRDRPSGGRRPPGSTRERPPWPCSSAVAFVEPVTSSKRTGASRPTAASARSSSLADSIRLTPSGASPIIASQPWRRNRRS